ncbi:MAG: regulatory protein RecX [Thiogranum sp.]
MNPQAETDDSTERCQQSYATALRLLARREHSELELRNKLAARKFSDEVIATVLAGLLDEGLLSNRRFVEVYVRSRFERGYGPVRIRAELRERGIGAELMEQPLAELSQSWVESAARQRHKRFGRQVPDDYRERTRQMHFLQRRGFSGEQIRAAFDSF